MEVPGFPPLFRRCKTFDFCIVKPKVAPNRLSGVCMRAVLVAALICVPSLGAAQSKPYHDEISQVFRGSWAPTLADCRDAEGVNKVFIDGGSVNYYEGNDYLLIGIEFGGSMTKRGGSGSLFNGRLTG